MPADLAIRVENLTKTYRLYNSNLDRLKESLHPFRRKYHHEFNALHDVSFEIKKGGTVGVIGNNGSGKSTLLKLITGVLTPTSGSVAVNGKISALLELGSGFNPELTGIENVHFSGTLMGYSRDEIDARLDDILSFADIGEFVNQPVKSYSSGMFVRLAFAVAINVDPDILIIDEALAVGDIFFQQKCYGVIEKIISDGTTCLFVSHDKTVISRICSEAIILNNGKIDFYGNSTEAVNKHIYESNASLSLPTKSTMISNNKQKNSADEEGFSEDEVLKVISNSIDVSSKQGYGSGKAKILAIRVTNGNGQDTLSVDMMDHLNFYVLIKFMKEVENPNAGLELCDRLGNIVFAAGARHLRRDLPHANENDVILVQFKLSFTVQPGEYTFCITTGEPSSIVNYGHASHRYDMLGPIEVVCSDWHLRPFNGIAQLPMEIKYEFVNIKQAES